MASISVAMCTWNGARWVEQQLQSILRQTLAPCEIVICDDGSTDETARIIQRLAAGSSIPIRFEANPQNLGISRNFQRCMSLCRGELIALSDQDDFWHPRKLAVLAAALEQNPQAAYAFCDARLVDQNLRPMGFGLWELHQLTPQRQEILGGDAAMELLSIANFATGAAMLFRRSWMEHVLPVSPNWIHDGWIALMLSAFSYCIPVPEMLVDYRQHPAQKVGACRRSELRKVTWQRRMNRQFFSREAPRWADAYAHLAARRHLMRRPADLELIRGRAMLDRDRLLLREDPMMRWSLVADHWMRGDYQRYAWEARSALVDLIWHE